MALAWRLLSLSILVPPVAAVLCETSHSPRITTNVANGHSALSYDRPLWRRSLLGSPTVPGILDSSVRRVGRPNLTALLMHYHRLQLELFAQALGHLLRFLVIAPGSELHAIYAATCLHLKFLACLTGLSQASQFTTQT